MLNTFKWALNQQNPELFPNAQGPTLVERKAERVIVKYEDGTEEAIPVEGGYCILPTIKDALANWNKTTGDILILEGPATLNLSVPHTKKVSDTWTVIHVQKPGNEYSLNVSAKGNGNYTLTCISLDSTPTTKTYERSISGGGIHTYTMHGADDNDANDNNGVPPGYIVGALALAAALICVAVIRKGRNNKRKRLTNT